MNSILLIGGKFIHEDKNGTAITTNMVVTQGRNRIISSGLTSTNWYFVFFSKNITPDASWTAQNFNSLANEVVSYTSPTRPKWERSDVLEGGTDSYLNLCEVTASDNNTQIYGAGIVSSATKLSTTGVLLAAAKFDSPIILDIDETFRIGYGLQISATNF